MVLIYFKYILIGSVPRFSKFVKITQILPNFKWPKIQDVTQYAKFPRKYYEVLEVKILDPLIGCRKCVIFSSG